MSAFARVITVSWAYGKRTVEIYINDQKVQIIHLSNKNKYIFSEESDIFKV